MRSPKWDLYIKTPPPKAEGHYRRSGNRKNKVVDDYKKIVPSACSRVMTDTNSQLF